MRFIKLLVLLVILQEQILKYIPVPLSIYHYLRQLPDVLVVCGALVALIRANSGRIGGVPKALNAITIALAAFFIFSVAVSLFSSPPANLVFELLNVKALLRYTLLIYIVRSLDYSDSDFEGLYNFFFKLLILQIVLGVFQLLGGLEIRELLSSRHMIDGFVGDVQGNSQSRFREANHLIGSMGDNISYGYFIIVCVAVYLSNIKKLDLEGWVVILISAIFLFYSGSRGVILLLPILLLYKISLKNGAVSNLKLIFTATILLFPLLFIIYILGTKLGGDNNRAFGFIFTSEYIYVAMNQRLGIVLDLLPQLLQDVNVIFGFGPDKYNFADYAINTYVSSNPILIGYLPHVLEDVYWVALLVYYGPIGTLLWLYVLYLLFRQAIDASRNKHNHNTRRAGRLVLMLLIVAVAGAFINPVFEIRVFSFFLWLFAGFLYSADRKVSRTPRKRATPSLRAR